MRITHSANGIIVGSVPGHPAQTALVEARGALLYWDVLSDAVMPSAQIHDVDRAAEWLWEIYGPEAATAILIPGEHDVEFPVSANGVRDAVRALAQLTWAEAWWPTSVIADVPALDIALLRAEKTITTAAIDHLLDDEEATERALAAISQLNPNTDALAEDLSVLAEDYGIALPARVSATPSRDDYALAASGDGRTGGVVAMRGANVVDWTLIPHSTVDAAAEVSWTILRSGGASILEASVPRAPLAGSEPRLAARFGTVEFGLEYRERTITGQSPVPATVLLLPPAQRMLTVYAPDFAEAAVDPDAATRQTAIIARARARLTAPDATRTERAAGTT